MVDRSAVLSQFIGTSIGAVQTPLLREYVDTINPVVPGIGAFGRPSAIGGIISGLITLSFGIIGSTKKAGGVQRFSDSVVLALIGHGTTALETGVLSGLLPAVKSTSLAGMMEGSPADMNLLNNMSSELQRLQSENEQLRNMQIGTFPATIPPGTVADKQLRYGFMEPEYIVPGQPTRAARELGFMKQGTGRTPLAKVQEIKGKYGFLG